MGSPMYLRAFVIGSCAFVIIPLFLVVNSTHLHIAEYIPLLQILAPRKRRYSFENYVLVAPIFLGIANMMSLYISKKYTLSNSTRFLWTGLIIATIEILFSVLGNMYIFTKIEWLYYIALVYGGYFILWNYIIAYIENNV